MVDRGTEEVRDGLDIKGWLERKGSGGKKLVYNTKSALCRLACAPAAWS